MILFTPTESVLHSAYHSQNIVNVDQLAQNLILISNILRTAKSIVCTNAYVYYWWRRNSQRNSWGEIVKVRGYEWAKNCRENILFYSRGDEEET